MTTLERTTIEGVGRVYYDGDGQFYPSVTTVLGEKADSPGFKAWKRRTPKKERMRIRDFTANRGTLTHYALLNQLADRELWSGDERSSQADLKELLEEEEAEIGALRESTKERIKAGDEDAPDIQAHWDEEDERWVSDEWIRHKEGLEWSKKAWDAVRAERGITDDAVIDVELFVVNPYEKYAGQLDLLYRDPDGNITLCDLKTSKGVYDKHKLQGVCYAAALDIPIDRIEVVRINPDRKEWEISHDGEWGPSRAQFWEEFCELRERVASGNLEERLKEHVKNNDGETY